MVYWKIEYLEKHLEIEKRLNEKTTITKDYINHLETQLKLMKESYKKGFEDGKN